MKNITLFIVAIFISSSLLAQVQPLNASFENWASGNPVDWNTTNSMFATNVTEVTTGAQDGTSSIRCETIDVLGNTVPGLATLGVIDVVNQTISGGMPYTERPNVFTGYYKYAGVSGDMGSVIAYFTKWNGASRDTIGAAFFTATDTSAWTQFSDTVQYQFLDNPDTMNIVIIASGISLQIGSVIEIDNLAFVGLSVGVNDNLNANEIFNVYPNPAKDNINIRINNGENAEITLFNTIGQQVYKVKTSVSNNRIDVSQQHRGIYFIKVKLKDKVYTEKVFVN